MLLFFIMDSQVAWVLSACARILRPLVRLALAKGVKHRDLDELLRNLMLEEARQLWQERGVEPNISQLSITTGLNRKIVTSKVRDTTDELPQTEASAAARTVTLWLQQIADDASARQLPVMADADVPSFEALARAASRGNVHHRTILDELLRLGMASLRDGRVELKAGGFVPVEDLQAMLAFFSDNMRDHVNAGVSNVLGVKPPMLERAVFASGLSLDDCMQIHELVRQRWAGLQDELSREMRKAVDDAPAGANGRIRVGVFTYIEELAGSAENPPPRSLPPPQLPETFR